MSYPNPIDFAGRVAIVTGGTKGIGFVIAEHLLQAGAVVVVCGRNEPESLPTVDGRSAEFRALDVRDAAAAKAMVDEVAATHGRLDVLVNNAGGSPDADAATVSPRFVDAIVKLNLLAPFYLAQAANAVMQQQDAGGSIVNISSVSGHRPSPGTASYGAAKAGIDSLTQSLAVEWAPAVRVNSVVVGPVKTELAEMHYGDAEGVAAVDATIPMGRMAEPADVGQAAAFLASPLAAYITGAELLVHGGGEKPAFLSASTADTSR